jgi:hypothetical protein
MKLHDVMPRQEALAQLGLLRTRPLYDAWFNGPSHTALVAPLIDADAPAPSDAPHLRVVDGHQLQLFLPTPRAHSSSRGPLPKSRPLAHIFAQLPGSQVMYLGHATPGWRVPWVATSEEHYRLELCLEHVVPPSP